MAVKQELIDFHIDQLREFGSVDAKRMFGGVGFFRDGTMFGMISSDQVFRLKVDEHNQPDYEARGMQPLYMESKKKGMPYWEVPADIVDDSSKLSIWAKKAYDAALNK